jgi:soluble lytic murein transglycosylase-like protein
MKSRASPITHICKIGAAMIRKLTITTILVALAATPAFAQKQRFASLDANGNLDALIARHAAANNVPEDLVRRVIKRESGGNPRVVSAGNYGLMQIKLATARSMGYTGNAAGLLDANTNMTYAVKYLAGAYRVANGSNNRAVHYYAAGYYYAAKSKGMPMKSADNLPDAFASATPDSSVKFSSKRSLRREISHNESVASSSFYGGRPDYY